MACDMPWNPPSVEPTEKGWYEVRTPGTEGEPVQYRGWGGGIWWTPVGDGWRGSFNAEYEWRGPVADLSGPAPDGTNPEEGVTRL